MPRKEACSLLRPRLVSASAACGGIRVSSHLNSQGFATGDLADDAWAIRHFFHSTSLELLVAQSFSKNFGIYGERVGALHVVCRTEAAQSKTLGMLARLSRAEITTAPINGARIVAKVLEDGTLKDQWLSDLLHMSDRMRSMRRRLVEGLHKRHTPGSWDHILTDVRHAYFCGLFQNS